MTHPPTPADLIRIAYDEPRRAAASNPTVCLYLLATLEELIGLLDAPATDARVVELQRQARLVSEGCGGDDVPADDVEVVRTTYHLKFAPR